MPKNLFYRLCLCLVALPALALYWHLFPGKKIIDIPSNQITKGKGYAYHWKIPDPGFLSSYRSDNSQHPKASTLSLYENGAPLTHPHSPHKGISNIGLGQFSHWGNTLLFSTSDNSSVSNNGREYRIEVDALPEPAITYTSALAFLVWLLALSFSTKGIRTLLSISTLLAVIAALIATFTRVNPLRYELIFSHDPASKEENYTGFPGFTLYRYTLEPLIAPFLEINFTPPVKTDHLLLRIGSAEPLKVVLNDEINPFTWEPHRNFVLDLRSVVYGIQSVSTEPSHQELRLDSPLSVTKGGILLLWIVSAICLVSLLSQRHCKKPLSRLAMLAASVTLTLGGFLVASNLLGLFLSLNKSDLSNLKGTPFGTHDRTLNWEDTEATLRELPAITEESDKILKASRLVAGRILHDWNYVDRDELYMQIPIWRNWILWLFGEVSPRYRRYIISDLPSALERGVGHCGQASIVLATLLQSHRVSAALVGLNGHTMVSVTEKKGGAFILDPDFGITFKGTYQEYIKEPELTERYSKALKDLGMREEIQPIVLRSVLSVFKRSNPASSSPEQFHGNTAFEENSYLYKWLIPSVGILTGILSLFIAIFTNCRGSGRNSKGI